MESAIRTFLATFFICVMAFLGLGLMEAATEAKNADAYLSSVVQQVEASNYSEEVINSLVADAPNHGYYGGYVLHIETFRSTQNNIAKYGTATLRYHFVVPLLGEVGEVKTLSKDIR